MMSGASTAGGPAACTSAATGPCHERVAVVAHRPIADRTWRIRVESPALAAAALPGQFAMLRLPDRTDPLLARPLAVYDVFSGPDGRPRYVDFVYAVHGRFTTALAGLPPGEELAIWGPLGNGFDPPPVGHLVLVAGGIGQTALLALARERSGLVHYGSPARTRSRVERITFCWGGRTAAVFGDVADFEAAGCEVHLATLDGTTGVRGTVVDLLDGLVADGKLGPAAALRVATCGPDAMMAAVARWTASHGIPCDASLETPMACGIGICFTCVAPIRDRDGGWDYRRTCVEGPVFDAASIVW
jgi:dihydroorotate dehydrogenase electron transfer subunit